MDDRSQLNQLGAVRKAHFFGRRLLLGQKATVFMQTLRYVHTERLSRCNRSDVAEVSGDKFRQSATATLRKALQMNMIGFKFQRRNRHNGATCDDLSLEDSR